MDILEDSETESPHLLAITENGPRQTDRQTDSQPDRQTDRHMKVEFAIKVYGGEIDESRSK